ncbi:DUF2513 domain-containing protein [Listeria monocytogenes]
MIILRLNQDCVRQVMLDIEERMPYDGYLAYDQLLDFNAHKQFGSDDVNYCIEKLSEAGFLTTRTFIQSGSKYDVSIESITWQGHLFLDNIRDNESWKKVKQIADKVASASLLVTAELAGKYVLSTISKHLGL